MKKFDTHTPTLPHVHWEWVSTPGARFFPPFSLCHLTSTLAILWTAWISDVHLVKPNGLFFHLSLSLTFLLHLSLLTISLPLECTPPIALLADFSCFCLHVSWITILSPHLCHLPFSPYTLYKQLADNCLRAHVLNLALDFLNLTHKSCPLGTYSRMGTGCRQKLEGSGHLNDALMEILGYFSLLPTIGNMTQEIFHLNPSSKLTSCLHFLDNSLGLWLYHLSRFPHSPPRCSVARHQLKAGMAWLILWWNESSVSSVKMRNFLFYVFKRFCFTFLLLLEFILNNTLVIMNFFNVQVFHLNNM